MFAMSLEIMISSLYLHTALITGCTRIATNNQKPPTIDLSSEPLMSRWFAAPHVALAGQDKPIASKTKSFLF